jgi:hypothetical protein
MLMTWAILVKLITVLIQSCHHSRFLETSFYFIHLSSLHKFVILCTPRSREPNPQVQWTWPLSLPSNLVGIASSLANLADLAVANLRRNL